MIRKAVDFALNNRFLVLAAAILLFGWGAISFHQLPVEAYPDVANNYVEVITQWPGISAEQIEQQVTIPLEIAMNGIPGMAHLRSFSIFGLSDLKLVFEDETSDFENRERVLERLSQVSLPPGVTPQMGTDWSPVGQIYFFTLENTNPAYDVMELKSIEDWVVEKNLKSVPNIVDVATFGGPTREYQVRVDPNKLIDYGLNLAQVEQQLTNSNANAGGSFIQAGLQQINVREVGLIKNVHDIENTVILTKNGTPIHVKDIAVVEQGPKIRLGQFARAIHREDGRIIDDPDVVSAWVPMRKGADAEPTLEGLHAKVKELNDHILPAGVKIVPFLDRDDLVHFTTHTVLHNLGEGILLVVVVLFLLLGNVRGALIVALTIPFSLLFAATCLKLKAIPANLLSLGALDFGMVVEGTVVMIENIVRHLNAQNGSERTTIQKIFDAAHEVQRPVFYRHPSDHHGVPSDIHPATRGRTIVQTHGVDGGIRAGRGHPVFDDGGARARQSLVSKGHAGMAQPGNGMDYGRLSQGSALGHSLAICYGRGGAGGGGAGGVPGPWPADRLRISSAPGRRGAVGAWHSGAQHRTR